MEFLFYWNAFYWAALAGMALRFSEIEGRDLVFNIICAPAMCFFLLLEIPYKRRPRFMNKVIWRSEEKPLP